MKRLLLCGVLLLSLWDSALAGQECGERAAPTPQALARGLALGQRVLQQLEQSGASAALVARVGVDLSEFGQHFTHMGVAVRDHVTNRWMTLHLLNQCGKSESEIVVQPLEGFFEVYLDKFDALVVTPSYARQVAERNVFMNPATTRLLHHKAYNLIAHPFNTRFQNSNQWVLETLALALAGSATITDRAAAQAWLKRSGYVPETVQIPNVRRLGAVLLSSHVSFADHTREELDKNAYQVVTVNSIVRLLEAQDPGMKQEVVR